MTAKVLCFILLLTGLSFGQDIQKLRIPTFLGLNNIDTYLEPGEATDAYNVDLSRSGIGKLAKRRGFEMIDSLTVVDSIVCLEALQFDDGSKYMLVIGADADSGWGRVYVSNEGSQNFSDDSLTEIYTRLPITEDVYVEKLRDLYYITTGVARGIVIGRVAGDFIARPFPMVSTDEPIIVPIKATDSVYRLNGTYYYVFTMCRGSFGSECESWGSTASEAVKVTNGRVNISRLPWMPPDSSYAAPLDPASIVVAVFRSRGDVGNLDVSDYAFYLGHFTLDSTNAALSAQIFIDSIPDDSLSTDSLQILDETWGGFYESCVVDPEDCIHRRFGAPGMVARDDWAAADTLTDGNNVGVYWGWPQDSSQTADQAVAAALGVSYMCTFIDTITNMESEAGPPFDFVRYAGDTVKSYALSIPKPPATMENVATNLYRTQIRAMSSTRKVIIPGTQNAQLAYYGDKIIIVPSSVTRQSFLANLYYLYGTPDSVVYSNTTRWRNELVLDTIYREQYKLVTQIADTSTVFIDSMRTDTLATRRPYIPKNVPPFLKSPVAYNGRLYGVYGSYLYRSEASTTSSWGLFDRVDINPGVDEATVVWPSQFALRVCKQFSNYNVIANEFEDAEIVGRWGCLASKSLAFSPVGPIYLSAGGVVQERDGQYLERTIVPGIISDKVGNFSDKTALELKNAVGQWLPREQQYWLNIGDTTWVWDWAASQRLNRNVWTTSSIDFAGGTLYDTASEFEVIPGRSLYFWRSGDNRIYRYGEGITNEEADYSVDGGGTVWIPTEYKTGPLLMGDEYSQAMGCGLLIQYDSLSADSSSIIEVEFYNEADASLGNIVFSDLGKRYIRGEEAQDPSFYYTLKIFTDSWSSLYSGMAIELLDLYYIPDAERIPITE